MIPFKFNLSAPLQIVVSVAFLWSILGPSALAVMAVVILLIPVNAGISSFYRKFLVKQMKQKDKRAKLMGEILQGIKVICQR
jgi:hypothetical protein